MFHVRALSRSLTRRTLFQLSRRHYLSQAYDCKSVWDSRLENDIIRKINIESMYYDINAYYNKTRKLVPIDIDIFLNSQNDDSYLMEAEEVVHHLRQSPFTTQTLPTTHHAFIRLFTTYQTDTLVRVLHDRINYGVYPDEYLIPYVIDKLLKRDEIRNAAKVGSLQMYQEDYSHPLVKYFSLYAIHRYLLTGQPWEDVVEKNVDEEEEEEEVKVRIKYLRQPYFDDHFDLQDGNHICGKSLAMISATLDNAAVKNSYKIMGLSLYNKWQKLENELSNLVALQKTTKEPVLYKESVEFVGKIINDTLKEEAEQSKLTKYITEINLEKCIADSLLDETERRLKETISATEKDMIQKQEVTYKEWELLREKVLLEHLQAVDRKNRLEEVERKKQELQSKEDLLYYFDKEDEIDLVCEQKKLLIWKRNYIRNQEVAEEEYVPPEIQKRQIIEVEEEEEDPK